MYIQNIIEECTLITWDRLDIITSCVQQVAHLEGDMAELGCYRGGCARLITFVNPNKKLHLFDTFEGIPADDEIKTGGHKKGDFPAPLLDVQKYLSGTNTVFHPGFFPATTIGLEALKFCFVHIDFDIYQSTAAALDYICPRMVKGGIIVLDDFNCEACPGVNKALAERGLLELVEQTVYAQCLLRF